MILGRSNHTAITNKYDNVDFNIAVEGCSYVDMFVEATEELASLESAMYVADVMLEEQVLEGATDVDVLLEGVVNSLYTRLKDAVQKLWAKIKQWFANVKKFFQVLFTHGKDFAKKYKTDIVKAEARCSGFKYDFYPVKAMQSIGGEGEATGAVEVEDDALTLAKKLLAKAGDQSNTEIVKEYMIANLWDGEDSQAEFNKKLREELLGGDSKEEFEDFSSGPSVQNMLFMLETGAKTIQLIEKGEKAINKACSKLVADLQKAENTAAKAVAQNPGTSLDKAYSLAVEIVKAQANCGVATCNTVKEVVKTLMRDSESVLKRLLSHKPKKEGFEGEDFEGHDSILEAALRAL